MATRRNDCNAQGLVEQGDREAVLAVLSASPSMTIEELLHRLPWIQWGHVFAILGECCQAGLVTLRQKHFQFEVLMIPASSGQSAEEVRKGPVRSRHENTPVGQSRRPTGSRHLTRS
jgi:hypothetical protein